MNIRKMSTIVLVFVLYVAACSQAGSIWVRKSKNMRDIYANDVAQKIGDILTISINESSTIDNKAKTTLEKKTKRSQNFNGQVGLEHILPEVPTLKLGAGTEYPGEAIPDVLLLNSQLAKQGKDLLVKVSLFDAYAWMPRAVILGTPVVNILFQSAPGLFRLDLARDRRTTMATFNEFAGIHQLMALVDLRAEQHLNSIESGPVDKRLMRARIPLVAVLEFTDVRAVT